MGLEQVRIFDEQNNRTGSVNINDLKYALNDGYKLHNAGENVKIIDPKTNRTGTVAINDLASALNDGYELAPATTKDYVQAGAQGLASKLGKYADTAVAAGSYLMSKNPLQKAVKAGADALGVGESLPNTQQLQEQAQDYWQNPKLEQVASDSLDTGMNYRQGIRAAQTAGEFVGDIPAFKAVGTAAKGITALTRAGTAIKAPWLDKLNKFLDVPTGNAKEVGAAVTSFAGGGAGIELVKSDNPNVGVAESIARDVIGLTLGTVLGQAIAHTGVKAVKAVGNALINPVETLKDFGITAATLPFRGKVDQKVYKNAKELGIELTPAMLTDSNLAKFVENNVFESIFVAKAYKNTIENISPSVIKAIDEKLAATVGKKIEPTATESAGSIVSRDVGEQLSENVQRWKSESKELFDSSKGALTANDQMAVPETIKTLDSMIDHLGSGLTNPQGTEKEVLDYLTQLKNVISQPSLKVTDLIREQERLLARGDYGEAKSYANYYNGAAGALMDEISQYKGNTSFADGWKNAKAFYKNNIVNGERSKISKSLLHEYSPKEAIDFMNSKQNIQTMERLIGDSENGKELMGSLRRAKIQEIMENRNVFTNNGEFNPDAFLNLFKKDDDILKTLMGKGYGELKENIAPVANAISVSKKTLNDKNNAAKAAAQYAILIGLTSLSAVKSAGASIAGIYGLSSAMANPKFVEKLIARSNSPRFTQKAKAYIKDLPNNPAIKAGIATKGAELLPAVVDNPMMDEYYNESR